MKVNLSGKTAIVTGGATGIGKATAIKLATAGASVVVSDINHKGAEKVVQEIIGLGGRATAVATDVSKEDDVINMVNQTLATYQRIDILVNNAGISRAVRFMDTDTEQFDRFFNINVKGVYLCCQKALPHMIKQKYGKIVNISSVAGREADEFFVVYSATKFAVMGFTQGLAKEMAEHNINVNAVCPGVVRTELWDNLLKQLKIIPKNSEFGEEQIWEKEMEMIPMRRPQTPEDIANAVVFLSSDLAANITGQGLNVCGGMRPR